MKTCIDSGCNRTDIVGRGLCSLHYQRYRYRGTLDEVAPVLAIGCAICGQLLPEDRDPKRIYCSRQCNEKARQARYREARTRRYSTCASCGIALTDQRTDARFCSVKCGQDARNARVAERNRMNRKPCKVCGELLPPKRHRYCSDPCKRADRRPSAYGLSPAELATLLAQHEVCAVCKTAEWGRKGPAVDHDHASGRVRGILCQNCNQGLGRFRDEPQRLQAAIDYLAR